MCKNSMCPQILRNITAPACSIRIKRYKATTMYNRSRSAAMKHFIEKLRAIELDVLLSEPTAIRSLEELDGQIKIGDVDTKLFLASLHMFCGIYREAFDYLQKARQELQTHVRWREMIRKRLCEGTADDLGRLWQLPDLCRRQIAEGL